MKVYVTKYALTSGILEVEATEEGNGIVRAGGPGINQLNAYYHGEGKDWHRDKSSAEARALNMRDKKVESLKKAIEKLEKLTF